MCTWQELGTSELPRLPAKRASCGGQQAAGISWSPGEGHVSGGQRQTEWGAGGVLSQGGLRPTARGESGHPRGRGLDQGQSRGLEPAASGTTLLCRSGSPVPSLGLHFSTCRTGPEQADLWRPSSPASWDLGRDLQGCSAAIHQPSDKALLYSRPDAGAGASDTDRYSQSPQSKRKTNTEQRGLHWGVSRCVLERRGEGERSLAQVPRECPALQLPWEVPLVPDELVSGSPSLEGCPTPQRLQGRTG